MVLKCEHEYQMLVTSAWMELGFIRFACVWCEVRVVQAHTCMWLCMPMHAHRGRGVGVLLCHNPPYSPKAGSPTGARLATSNAPPVFSLHSAEFQMPVCGHAYLYVLLLGSMSSRLCSKCCYPQSHHFSTKNKGRRSEQP